MDPYQDLRMFDRPAPTGDINARIQRAVEEYLG